MGISREKFRNSITNFYTKDGIYDIYKEYLIDWIADGYIGLHLDIFEVSLLSETTNKSVFVDLLEEAFYKQDTFVAVLNTLDEDIKDIFMFSLTSEKCLIKFFIARFSVFAALRKFFLAGRL